MSFFESCDFSSGAYSAAASGAPGKLALTVAPEEAAPLPRVVTTGRKKTSNKPEYAGFDQETGEPVELLHSGSRLSIVRHIESVQDVPETIAFVDALAFSVVPPEEESFHWLLQEMGQFLEIGTVEHRKGLFGFRYSARFGDGAGVIAWGGESQNDRVYFSVQGKGCSMISRWADLADWLQRHKASIKRVDLAHDDHAGRLVSIAWAVQQYQEGGFNAGGRNPVHSCAGDWLQGDASTKGRTLYIGNRASGKFGRFYEKGKQLGDPNSPWVRVEVEWRAQDRYIPYDILIRPGHYLAGAYPCLAILNEEQSTIKTVTKAAQIAFDAAVENGKRACGKLVNLMLEVMQGDYAAVVDKLLRPGIPARIDPYSYHVKKTPAMLDWELRGGDI